MGDIADDHYSQMWDELCDDESDAYERAQSYPASRPVRCRMCGSTDVRWRMQTGKWTLFATTPGVLHVCPIKDDFDVVPE